MGQGFVAQRSIFFVGLVWLAGCAGIPPDLGRDEVGVMVAERGRVVDQVASDQAIQELVSGLQKAPLEPRDAVRIALLSNPSLQARYAELGFGAADLYAASRIRNPAFSGGWLDSDIAGEGRQVTLAVAVSLADLITLPARKRLGAAAYAALKQSVAADVLAVAAHTERAYYHFVGAQQIAALRTQTARAAALSAALAERFYAAGNISARELALERAAASEARLAALQADRESFDARAALAELMGVSVGAAWDAPAQLRLPAAEEDELDALLALAYESRLDLAAARAEADMLADRLGTVRWTRWLGDLDVGLERERETDGAVLRGPTAEWEVPIFNQHNDAVLRADAELQVALAQVRRITLDVENSARLAYKALASARERVREHAEVLIPQRREAVARAQEQVNFMLIGVFELLAIKQEEYDAYQGYLESIRDYWLARVDLGAAVGTSLPSDSAITEQRLDVDGLIGPPNEAMDHQMPDHSRHKGSNTDPASETHEHGHQAHPDHGEGGSR